jgi:hypothetical protein
MNKKQNICFSFDPQKPSLQLMLREGTTPGGGGRGRGARDRCLF